MTQTYVFDNAWQQERPRLDALETIWDAWTFQQLGAVSVSDGWHCAEVGAGGGSVAAWLCRRVGPAGRVVATDLDTRLLDGVEEPNLEVRRHDITAEDLEPGAYDLVHARLLLEHLPAHEQALQRMLAALKPGGWLVVEEFDHGTFMPDPGCSEEQRAPLGRVAGGLRLPRRRTGAGPGLRLPALRAVAAPRPRRRER